MTTGAMTDAISCCQYPALARSLDRIRDAAMSHSGPVMRNVAGM